MIWGGGGGAISLYCDVSNRCVRVCMCVRALLGANRWWGGGAASAMTWSCAFLQTSVRATDRMLIDTRVVFAHVARCPITTERRRHAIDVKNKFLDPPRAPARRVAALGLAHDTPPT